MDNPLQKYVDKAPYVQPVISPSLAQYILKALDFLHIYAQKMDEPAIIEPALHDEAETAMTDIIVDAPDHG
jgi:hypothetical protein